MILILSQYCLQFYQVTVSATESGRHGGFSNTWNICRGQIYHVFKNTEPIVFVPDTASYIRGWMQMVLTPNDLFSRNNKYSKYMIILSHIYTSTTDSSSIFQLCTSLTLCMLAFWSCEGVVFLVLSSSSHLTMGHVSPLPMSRANWRSLSLLWGLGPPFPKMAPSFTGSAHTPFPEYKTVLVNLKSTRF